MSPEFQLRSNEGSNETIGLAEFKNISDSNPFPNERKVYIEKKSYG
jgi:hypothetical protein